MEDAPPRKVPTAERSALSSPKVQKWIADLGKYGKILRILKKRGELNANETRFGDGLFAERDDIHMTLIHNAWVGLTSMS